ncbi:hypothetical protein [Caulobacter sp. X]|uniref:hypothetical protein n=1 Tax=Caulobacter sp. X TaxID=2048901 RepID=UPI000C152311|nr:hypothetical protein [Caulobacter sp. X]PIC00893.1 hypothetical protein CSW60_04895 [Caulobacter sp. X]
MKHIIGPMAGLVMAVMLSGCAGLAADPVTLARAVQILNEGCERTVDLTLDKAQPGGGALKVTRACPPAPQAVSAEPKP